MSASTTARAASTASERTGSLSITRADVLNVAILLLGYAVVVVLISPVRSFPINDDWVYANSVRDILNGVYRPNDWSLAMSLGHNLWGAAFASVFGLSFTTLAVAELVMSAICVLLFYALLRAMGLGGGGALLGSALLGLNPIFVYLSYSFMTDVTFLAFSLGSLLCFVLGARQSAAAGYAWLAAGSVLTAIAYLTRQFGITLVPAALLYLWFARRLNWKTTVAIVALPLAVAAGYAIWESTQPTPLVALDIERMRRQAVDSPFEYWMDRAQRLSWIFAMFGLWLAPVALRARRILVAVALAALPVVLLFRTAAMYGTVFPQSGNIVDTTGYVMGYYDAAQVWVRQIWTALAIVGAFVLAAHLATLGEGAAAWLRSRPWQRLDAADPTVMLWVWAALLIVVMVAFPPYLFDRYFLPVLLVMVIPALRRVGAGGPSARRAWALLAVVGLFALVAQRDYLDHAAARWKAADQALGRGAPANRIHAGFEWDGWYLNDAGVKHIRETGDLTYIYFPALAVLDPEYRVSDLPEPGYTTLGEVPYSSWLDGGQRRVVLLQQRAK